MKYITTIDDKEFLVEIIDDRHVSIDGKIVEVDPVTVDRYGRTIALVYDTDGKSLNEELVRAGFAWVYTRYCDWAICETWEGLETEAREAKLGLWSDPRAIAPWEFRRKKRSR